MNLLELSSRKDGHSLQKENRNVDEGTKWHVDHVQHADTKLGQLKNNYKIDEGKFNALRYHVVNHEAKGGKTGQEIIGKATS